MLRIIALVISLVSYVNCFSQEKISGRVLDRETGVPVKYAQIYFSGTYCGTATNSNGEFLLDNSTCAGDQLIITAVPYEKAVISLKDLSSPAEILVQRKQMRTTLRLDQTRICQLIDSALFRIPRNYHIENFKATSFHREYVKSFDNIIQVMEVIVSSDFATKNTTTSLIDGLFAEEKNQKDQFWNPATGGFYSFGWNQIPDEGHPSQEYFLGLHLRKANAPGKYYQFTSPGVVYDSSETLYVIDFDQKDQIRGALLKGRMYIDSATMAIAKISYSISPKGFPYIMPNRTIGGVRICKPPLRHDIVRESGEIHYAKFGDRWHLASQITDTEFNAFLDSIAGTPRDARYLRLHAQRFTTALNASPPERSANHSQRTKTFTHNYIKSHYENYDQTKSLWQGHNIVKPDTSIADVIHTLRLNNQLWERKEGRRAKEELASSTTFAPDDLKKDLAYLKKMFLLLHPALNAPAQKSHFIRAIGNTERHVQRNMSETEFYKYLSPVIESLHCGHTQLRPSPAMEEYNRKFGKYFPFDVTVIGRRAFLSSGVSDTARGSEIQKINGTAISSILQNIRYKASTEGMSTASKDHYLGKHFAELYAANYLQSDSFDIELKTWNSKDIVSRTFPASGYRIEDDIETAIISELDSLQSVVLNIPSGTTESEKKVLLAKIFSAINDKRFPNLVIDLRDNKDFRDSDGSVLFSHLIANPIAYFDRIVLSTADSAIYSQLFVDEKSFADAVPAFLAAISPSDTLITYNHPPTHSVESRNMNTYHGNVFVLINGGTGPAAADFAKYLQSKNRAIIVGQEIHAGFHGSCDAGETYLSLPHSKLRVSLPLASYSADIPEGDSRLIPDHIVDYTMEDIVKKKDLEMESCRQLILESAGTAKSN